MSKYLIRNLLSERLQEIAHKDEILRHYGGRYMFDVTKAYNLIDAKGINVEVKPFNPALLKQFSHPIFSTVDDKKLGRLKKTIDYQRPLGILVNFRDPESRKTEWVLIDGNHRVRVAGEADKNGLLYVIKNPDDVAKFMQVDTAKSHNLFPDED